MSFSAIFTNAGIFVVYLLGLFLSWRSVATICMFIPILCMLIALFVCITFILHISR